jgi:hypothetical protein
MALLTATCLKQSKLKINYDKVLIASKKKCGNFTM